MTTRALRTTPFLSLVEGMSKRSVMRAVSKLGNSSQGSCQACGADKKEQKENRERQNDFPRQRTRAKAASIPSRHTPEIVSGSF